MSSFFDPSSEVDKHHHKLPHWQQAETWIFLTWRLADSLPLSKLKPWREAREIWLQHHPQPWDERTEEAYHERFSREIDKWLDAGSGSCLLRDPANARIVAEALHFFHEERYLLSTYVVMPNHVHVLFAPLSGHKLPDVVHSWKRFTARKINLREEKTGALWQPDYWDRLIRSKEHYEWVLKYIAGNPAKLPAGSYLLWP